MRDLLDTAGSSPAALLSRRPVISIAFSSIEGIKEVMAFGQEISRELLQLHNACVRETLSTCGG